MTLAYLFTCHANDGGEGTLKVPRISSSLLALELRQKATINLGQALFCKYINLIILKIKSMAQIICST